MGLTTLTQQEEDDLKTLSQDWFSMFSEHFPVDPGDFTMSAMQESYVKEFISQFDLFQGDFLEFSLAGIKTECFGFPVSDKKIEENRKS